MRSHQNRCDITKTQGEGGVRGGSTDFTRCTNLQ